VAHPYFDTTSFPFWRPEAAAFLDTISSTYPEREDIKAFYVDSGGNLALLRTDLEPVNIWRHVLRILARQRTFEKLCRLLLKSDEAATIAEVTQAIVDADVEVVMADPREPFLQPSNDETQFSFLKYGIDVAPFQGGITIFISPYASYDVDEVGDPRQLARTLLERSFDDLKKASKGGGHPTSPEVNLESDALLNLLVATASGRAIAGNYNTLWEKMCDIADPEAERSRLYPELADLGRSWELSKLGRPSKVRWPGILLVTFDMSSRLESELVDAGVNFGVLSVQADRRFTYHRSLGRDVGRKLRFEEVWSNPAGQPAPDSTISRTSPTADFMPDQPVIVVKLMGLAQLRDLRPWLGLEMLNISRDGEKLPETIGNHVENCPFVMVGGGLFDPFVAVALEAHFRNAGLVLSTGRWIVLHPSLPNDTLRVAEYVINRFDGQWTENVFKLKLLVEDLPAMIGRMSERLLEHVTTRSAA
jgi:hypothetical protein